jgi:hypothetical protein
MNEQGVPHLRHLLGEGLGLLAVGDKAGFTERLLHPIAYDVPGDAVVNYLKMCARTASNLISMSANCQAGNGMLPESSSS